MKTDVSQEVEVSENFVENILEELSIDGEPEMVDMDEILGDSTVDFPEDESTETVSDSDIESETTSADFLVQQALEEAQKLISEDTTVQESAIAEDIEEVLMEEMAESEEAMTQPSGLMNSHLPSGFQPRRATGHALEIVELEIVRRMGQEEGARYIQSLTIKELMNLRSVILKYS